jgi:hypothetical protein
LRIKTRDLVRIDGIENADQAAEERRTGGNTGPRADLRIEAGKGQRS